MDTNLNTPLEYFDPMDIPQILIVVIALATYHLWQMAITGYYKLPHIFHNHDDIFAKRHRRRLDIIKKRILSTWTIPLALTALSLTLTSWWNWETVDPHYLIRPAILAASGVMTWRAITMDVDLATGAGYPFQRALILLAWIGVWFYPGFLILLLHTGITWLRSNYHHQHLSIRVMIILLSCLGALPLLALVAEVTDLDFAPDLSVPSMFLFLCVTTTTYFVAVMKKANLGPHWYSWMMNNRLHAIAVSAYLWGWVRFLPEGLVVRIVQALRPFDRVFQVTTFTLQFCSIFILFNQTFGVVLLHSFIMFQTIVVVLSGIFFWQYLVVNSMLLWAVYNLPAGIDSELFGLQNGLLAIAIVSLGRWIWRPIRLGWWDTAFSCRVHYEVKGRSGKRYGLYNDFMCPNERIFGQTYGAQLSHEKRLNGHVGESKERHQADALYGVGKDLSKLEDAKQKFGRSRYIEKFEEEYDIYVKRFFRNYNAGHRKRVVPPWLKAPGGQLFYWGSLPRFTGQEPVDGLDVVYREYYFDGDQVHLVTENKIKHFGKSDLHHDPTRSAGIQYQNEP